MYDAEPFIGTIDFIRPSDILEVGDFTYQVDKITDNQHGLTSFTSDEVTSILKKLKQQ